MTNTESVISVLVASPFAEDLEAFRLAFALRLGLETGRVRDCREGLGGAFTGIAWM